MNFDNIVISQLIDTKSNSKYVIRYFDEVTRPLALILLKMSRYVKIFKEKNNLHIDDDKLLQFLIFNPRKVLWNCLKSRFFSKFFCYITWFVISPD